MSHQPVFVVHGQILTHRPCAIVEQKRRTAYKTIFSHSYRQYVILQICGVRSY